jgi:hypothetical protein
MPTGTKTRAGHLLGRARSAVRVRQVGSALFSQATGAFSPFREVVSKAIIRRSGDFWSRLPVAASLLAEESVASLVDPIPHETLSKETTFRAQANGWINVENPRLVRPLHRFSKARNSIRLVLDHSHLWSSRMRGLREILAHPAKKPMGHPKTSGICRLPVKDRIQNNNEPPCPREFLAQPTEFEKSEVLQHPLARSSYSVMTT